MQHTPADHDANNANGNVDIKNPAPVNIFSEIPADNRAKGRSNEDRNAKDAIGKTSLFLGESPKDEREGKRKECSSTCSLEDTKEDEDIDIPGDATQG